MMVEDESAMASAVPFFLGNPLPEQPPRANRQPLSPEPPTETQAGPDACGFAWGDFQRGIGEFRVEKDERGGAGWQLTSSTSKDGVEVIVHSRRLAEKGGLSEFLVRGSLPITRDAFFALNADLEYRPDWDDMCLSLGELSASGPGAEAGPLVRRQRVLHWEVKYPWPLGKRDYLLEQIVHTRTDEDGEIVRCLQGCTLPASVASSMRPCNHGVTRIEDYRATMAIWGSTSAREAQFALLYFEDSKVSVPSWIASQIAGKALPGGFAALVPVAGKYPRARQMQILGRHGISSDDASSLGEPAGCPNFDMAALDSDADEDGFFSASDDESSEKEAPCPRPAKPRGVIARMLAAGAADPTSPVQAKSTPPYVRISLDDAKSGKDGPDVEEGLLILCSEDRALLFDLLADARELHKGQSWWRWLCPGSCRLCGHRRRHKV